MKNLTRIILLCVMMIVSSCAYAQDNADQLYLQGQKLQQTMTVASQNQAIAKFKSAKAIYKVKAKQEMCDNQIATCNKNIQTLSQAQKLYQEGLSLQKVKTVESQNQAINKFTSAKASFAAKADKALCDKQIGICKGIIAELGQDPIPDLAPAPDPTVTINVSPDRLDFKGKVKKGATQSVEISGNCDGWDITAKPDWVTVSVTAGKFYVEAQENNTGAKRSGVITVSCKGKSVNVVVNQDKSKLLPFL